jgi:hypothetical protein
VIARLFGIRVDHVSLYPGVDSGAHAMTESAAYKARDADIATQIAGFEADIKVCFAGPHAQQQYRAAPHSAVTPYEWADDIADATKLSLQAVVTKRGMRIPDGGCKYTPSADESAETEQLFDRLYNETGILVAENWNAIARVAKALVKCRDRRRDRRPDRRPADRSVTANIGAGSMNRSQNVLKIVSAEFQRHGIKFGTSITGRSHIRLSWQVPGRARRRYVIPNSPSDGRGWLNARAAVRRMLRSDGMQP